MHLHICSKLNSCAKNRSRKQSRRIFIQFNLFHCIHLLFHPFQKCCYLKISSKSISVEWFRRRVGRFTKIEWAHSMGPIDLIAHQTAVTWSKTKRIPCEKTLPQCIPSVLFPLFHSQMKWQLISFVWFAAHCLFPSAVNNSEMFSFLLFFFFWCTTSGWTRQRKRTMRENRR